MLDLILVNSCVAGVSVLVCSGIVSPEVHHKPLDITVNINTPFTISNNNSTCYNNNSTANTTIERNFRKADFLELYSGLAAIDWEPVYSCDNVEAAVDTLYTLINNIICQTVPLKKTKGKRQHYPKWLTPTSIKLNNMKNHYHRLYKQNDQNQLNYAFFSYYRRLLRKSTEADFASYTDRIQSNIKRDPKTFWNFVKNNRESNEPATFGDMSPTQVADAFSKYFGSVFLPNIPSLDPVSALASANNSSNCTSQQIIIEYIQESEVRGAIARLRPKSTQGPDGIPQYVVRDGCAIFTQPLQFIFNLSVTSNVYPTVWKTSKVLPVHKSGPKSDIKNYRPIAVLSIFGKVFESVLYKKIYKQLQRWFADEQHGFVSNRSTTSNLLNITTLLAGNMNCKKQVDVAYFDFQKAFDRVDNDILLSKLAMAGFSLTLLKFIANYLHDRKQYVTYKYANSECYAVTSGIGQGTNLGPLLFLIVINDLPACVKHSTVLMYADDVKVALPIVNSSDTAALQRDIDSIQTWSAANNLSLNVGKCAIMTFSKATQPINNVYTLNSEPLKRVPTIRDLGTNFDSHLTFNQHIIHTCSKSRKNLGFVLRQAKIFNNRQTIILLYNSYIRSLLETNSIIWNPHEKKYTLVLERVQKSFVRYLYFKIYGYYPYMYPTPFILGMVNYQSLEVRRNIATVKYFFRLVRGSHFNSFLLQFISFNVPLPCLNALRPRQRPLFSMPQIRSVTLKTSSLYVALTHINNILLYDESLDVFASTELRFLTTAARYLESIAAPSTIALY